MPELAYVGGELLPIDRAVVSIEDRGFQFADGVYEVISTYGGVLFALEEHMLLLERSLAALRISYDIREERLPQQILRGVEACGFEDVLVYVQITRGAAPRHHEFPSPSVPPTVVMTFKELYRLAPERYALGVSVISTPDLRWKRCDIKSIALLANILAKQEAHERGAFEALLVDGEGMVTEGSSTSAFCVRKGTIYVPPLGPHILPSVTRMVLLELACDMGVNVVEKSLSLSAFKEAEEVFLAGTTTEAIGVVALDGTTIGSGEPGPVTQKLRAAFLERTARR